MTERLETQAREAAERALVKGLRVEGDCFVWTGNRDKKGYGNIYVGGQRFRAHRLAWEMNDGPVPEGLLVCHTCDNPPCCRPDHLFIGTVKDNTQDAARKGRLFAQREPHRSARNYGPPRSGATHPYAKLNEDAVRGIRAELMRGVLTHEAIGARYGVSRSNVSLIRRGLAWKQVV